MLSLMLFFLVFRTSAETSTRDPVRASVLSLVALSSVSAFRSLKICPSYGLKYSCRHSEQNASQHGQPHMECAVNVTCGGSPCVSSVCSDDISAGEPSVSFLQLVRLTNINVQQAGFSRSVEPPVNEIPSITEFFSDGGFFSYSFSFTSNTPVKKCVCKGRYTHNCSHEKVSDDMKLLTDDKSSVKIHMNNMKRKDFGIYWFGVHNVNKSKDLFFLKLVLVYSPAPTAAPVDYSIVWLVCGVLVPVCLLLLLTLPIYKRFSKARRHTEVEQDGEVNEVSENQYEGIAFEARSIYVSAHFSTNQNLSDCDVHSSDDNTTVDLKQSDCSTEHLYSTIQKYDSGTVCTS